MKRVCNMTSTASSNGISPQEWPRRRLLKYIRNMVNNYFGKIKNMIKWNFRGINWYIEFTGANYSPNDLCLINMYANVTALLQY